MLLKVNFIQEVFSFLQNIVLVIFKVTRPVLKLRTLFLQFADLLHFYSFYGNRDGLLEVNVALFTSSWRSTRTGWMGPRMGGPSMLPPRPPGPIILPVLDWFAPVFVPVAVTEPVSLTEESDLYSCCASPRAKCHVVVSRANFHVVVSRANCHVVICT